MKTGRKSENGYLIYLNLFPYLSSLFAHPHREGRRSKVPRSLSVRRGRSRYTVVVVCAWITHEKEMTNGDASFASAQWRPGLSPQSLLRLGLDADPDLTS